MFFVRTRKKKLTVAFHFLFANQAAWKCDTCRKQGLERKRKCGFLGMADVRDTRPVWIRKGVGVTSCPKSFITGESLALVEEYQARFVLGKTGDLAELPAKTVDAFCLLEQLMAKERSNDE